MNGKIRKGLFLLLSVLLCITMSACLTFVSKLGQIYYDALHTDELIDRQYAYGDENKLGISFENGSMYAVWDSTESADYALTVKNGTQTDTFTSADAGFSAGKTNLTALGYEYGQDLTLSLQSTTRTVMGKSTKSYAYSYSGLTAANYDKYTKTVAAGFKDIDYYIATRAEWFEFWSYLIIFRENCKNTGGCYELESSFYMAYDFAALYDTADRAKAFAFEVYSAIDAYEDSAAYNYSFELDSTGKIGSVYIKFLYGTNPKYSSPSGSKYTNELDSKESVHYGTKPAERELAIDAVQDAVAVNSSDQLYFALKKGYRPVPDKGSNAEHIYGEMRSILSKIIKDGDGDAAKVHYIYDYLVDTVIYDYDFTDEIYDDDKAVSELFSYRCMYMEGVFGLGDKGEFDYGSRVAICDGLSKAFLSLATIEGIECKKISGTVNGEGHAWNKVRVRGIWYMVDTTWGNSLETATGKEYFNHKYLMVPDDSAHVETPYITYPSASARYNFGITVDNDPSNDHKIINPWFPGGKYQTDPHFKA